jgi:exodeoxyribonuclease V gamma subunit
MSGFNIYTSNRMEILAGQLARVVRTPLASPLAPEVIVVQSRGMERWISMELAGLNGISANCSFPFPNVFLEGIFKQMMPDLPEVSAFDREIMTFRLMKIIPGFLSGVGFEDIKAYLVDDENHLKLFQLSVRIADLFDQYLVFRPQLIFQWEQMKEEKGTPQVWQAKLWRALASGVENRHRARLRENLLEQIRNLRLDPTHLPQRVSIFGISYLPLFHLQVFAELSRLMDIHFFLIQPCREYWADITSDKEIKKIRRKYPQVAENIEWYHFEIGNRLLAAMGALGRDFFKLVSDLDCGIHGQFEEPGESSVLTCIQSDILNLTDRETIASDEGGSRLSDPRPSNGLRPEPFRMSGQDTSIQVHSCHSPMREIEVLHDNLLGMFEEEPALLPKDIIVMMPDVETYAPYIRAVFDAQTDASLRIPFSIADQSARNGSRIIEGFLALLEIADSRFEAVQVVDLLAFPGIKEKFDLLESDIITIERWVADTHIRWGIDADSRIDAGLPGFRENTWQAGLERLVLGYAMPGETRDMFNGILPYDFIEGGDAGILGKFLEFVDRLFTWSKKLNASRKLSEWQKILFALLDHFFRPDENGERELQLLRNLLDELADTEKYSDYREDIPPAVIRFHLKSRLAQTNYGSGFLTGGVTFCALLPMRSIPFEVVCLIGMNNDAYPRDYQPLNFDLIARFPKPGDRSRRNDDKYLFLESIISARKKLYISYVGQNIRDNSTVPPSVLVSELLDTIETSVDACGTNILEKILTIHRLQPFSPWYFRQKTGLFSYSNENMLACVGAAEKGKPRPFVTEQLPMTPEEAEEWRQLDLEAVCLFFNHPVRFLIQNRLGIMLEDEVTLSEVRETFVLAALEKFLVEQNLFKTRLSGLALEDFRPVQKALGQLPHGNVGDYHYNRMTIDVENFVSRIERFTGAKPQNPMEIDFEISGFHLRGRLSEISDTGYVHIRYARKRVKDLLRTWIYHLVLCHETLPDFHLNSYLICKDSAVRFDRVRGSRQVLEDMLVLFRQGLSEPIHFFPESSFAYADHMRLESTTDESALNKAKKKWLAANSAKKFARGESDDPYYDLCFRHKDPLDDAFKQIAMKVFTPLLAHCREIIL